MRPADAAVGWRTHLAVAGLTAVVVGGLVAGVRDPAPPAGSGEVRSATCRDPADDVRTVAAYGSPVAAVTGTDLREVTLEADAQDLTVRFATVAPPPHDIGQVDEDPGTPIQWIVWLMDGEQPVYHLRAILRPDGWEVLHDDLRHEPVVRAGPPAIDGRSLGWTVPLSELPGLPEEFGWVALTTYGQPSVQDVCPDAATSSLAPDVQQPFPGPG